MENGKWRMEDGRWRIGVCPLFERIKTTDEHR